MAKSSTSSSEEPAKQTGYAEKQSISTLTPEQTAESIKNIARRIREESAKMRDAVRVIRQSGAIEELTDAVREATLAARDSVREINEASAELKKRGVIKETIAAAREAKDSAYDTAQNVRETVSTNKTNQTPT